MSGTRVDLHVKVLSGAVIERAKARGLDVLVYAPHFQRLPEIREAAREASDDDLLVVPGREVFTGRWQERRHVLALGLTDPVPDFVTLDAAMAEFERQGAAVLVPHPGFLTVSLDREEVADRAHRVHAVETYNPKQAAIGQDVSGLAADLDLPAFGSSYAHLAGTVGEVWTEFDADVTAEAALVAALKEGAPRTVGHRPGTTHHLRCLAEFAHLGWENSWKRIDRVLLSGMEATHPAQVAYDGRFDDATVY